MTNIVTISATVEADGHPDECTNPVSGSVTSTGSSSVSIGGNGVATVDTANIHFDSHSHDYDTTDGCHNDQAHDIDPSTVTSSVSLNGSPLYIDGANIGTDPISGGQISVTDVGTNNSVRVT